MTAKTKINISSCIRAVPSDFVRLEGTVVIMLTLCDFVLDGYLFEIISDDFKFTGGIFNKTITLQRNDQILNLPVEHSFKGYEYSAIFLGWSPVVLNASYAIIPCFTNIVDKEIELKTQYTVPPHSLVVWLRKENLIETIQYDDEEAFRDKAYSIINSLEQKISEMPSINAFWNITYEGNKIVAKQPKRETDIQPVIQAILSDQMFMSSIEVVPEYTTGVGRLDFMLMATMKNGRIGKICIEIKSAHSDDLIKGLTRQLPSYMENTNVNSGIYLILWFGNYFNSSLNVKYADLGVEIMNHQIRQGSELAKRIRFFSVDLTKSASASKLN